MDVLIGLLKYKNTCCAFKIIESDLLIETPINYAITFREFLKNKLLIFVGNKKL
jgi:hypothetical protein